MNNGEKRLTLAYQNLDSISNLFLESLPYDIEILDVSHNHLRDVGFLQHFPFLTSIILDHNELDDQVIFPHLSTVTLLWLNYNRINKLQPFVNNLLLSFPNLKHLCLMGNSVSPPCQEDTFYHYLQYRLYTILCLESLEVLDDRPVTDYERAESRRLFHSSPPSPTLYSTVISALSAFKNIVLSD